MDYGYDSDAGFYKAFLKEYGCSPTEYRKQVKESQLYYEQRRIAMIPLSDRVAALREEATNTRRFTAQFSMQYPVYRVIGQAEAALQKKPRTQILASGMACMLERFVPVIIPGELVVGFNFGEDTDEHYVPQNNETDICRMRTSHIPEEDISRYLELLAHPVADPNPMVRVSFTQHDAETLYERAASGRCTDSDHSVIGYQQVLERGFAGLLADVEAAEAKNGPRPLYKAAKRICTAACAMGEKFAAHARELLESGDETYNPADLQHIIGVCSRVPRHPATSFAEAVQALWFAHIVNTWEDYINANSLGRLDQILYPYYKADVEKGILTREQAYELICCLWVKLYRIYDVQQSCIGGTHPDGTSAVNELSYLMLDATEQLDFIRCLSVRYGSATERAFLKRALEVVGHLQKGVPFFFNDDVMIPALEAKGISHAHACDYTQIGCVETVIPGRSNPHAVSGEVNMLKALEYVLENGRSMLRPELGAGVETGPLEHLSTFETFYRAVMQQVTRLLELCCAATAEHQRASMCNTPRPYKSLLTEGCIESGRDFNEAGALYDYYQIMLCGLPNLADSLAVVKKFVYEEQRYTLKELKAMLEADFPDEAVRQEFIHKAPKYGNDIDQVDEIAAKLLNDACDVLDALSDKHGLSFHAQPFTYLWMVEHGRESAASPDGRRAGDPLAYSCSAMQGRDFSGLTALLNSLSKLPTKRTPGTTSAIVEVDPKLFCDRNMEALTDIFIAASRQGLSNVQFNITDADTLLDAQKHPERYLNLAVRVSGFSHKFVLLAPHLQEHIIGRTKHQCL